MAQRDLKPRMRRVHRRFLLYSCLIVFAAMLGLGVFVRARFLSSLLAQAEAGAQEFQKYLVSELTPLLTAYNYSTIQSAVDSASTQGDVVYLAVYDKEMNLAAANRPYELSRERILQISDTPPGAVSTVRISQCRVALAGGRAVSVLDVLSPVFVAGSTRKWGVVHIGLSLEGVYDTLHRVEQIIGVAFVLTILSISVMLRYLSGIIRKPMEMLVQGAGEIGSGDLRFHFPARYDNEFGYLAGSFNDMVDRVNLLQCRLEAWNRDLETRVEERTRTLQETRLFLENVFNSITECILTIGAEGTLVYANREFFRLASLGPEVLGTPMLGIVQGMGMRRFTSLRLFLRAVKGRQSHVETELAAGGVARCLDISSGPLSGGGGQSQGVLVIVRDVTQQRENERRLLLTEKMESVCTLGGGIAHDFNNVLAAILPAVEVLKARVQQPPDLARKIEIVELSARRAAELTAQLMTFSLRKDTPFCQTNLNDVCSGACERLRGDLAARVRLEACLDPRLPEVQGSPAMLSQMLDNLLENAVDSISGTGAVTVRSGLFRPAEEFLKRHPEVPDAPYAEIRVEDTGEGIEEKHLNRIYDPFFTTRHMSENAGMGLAVVFGTVKKHNGYVFCRSTRGAGTEFQILIPAVSCAADATFEAHTGPAVSKAGILVVDDEHMVREIAVDLLRELGYTVNSAENGFKALEIVKKEPPDTFQLLVLDMIMPGMDGLATLQAIRQVLPDVATIILSGYDTDERIRQALATKRTAFIQKPYRIAELAETVQRVLMLET